nr:hypothetical protein [Clostridia bacterium]
MVLLDVRNHGKTELANICKEYGYEILSFATPLKNLIANLLGITIKQVNELKKVNKTYVLQNMDLVFLSKETNIPLDIVKEKCGEKTFKNTRELMQYIGTDLIREYNPDWHVNKTREIIINDLNKNYVIDDVRFPNERKMIEELGGTCWFIIRPKLDNVSNHLSETALKWQEFENLIINDNSLNYLKYRWNIFIEDDYMESLKSRKKILYNLYGDKETINILKEKKENFTLLDMLFISKDEFTYNAKYRNNENVTKVEQCDGYVNVYSSGDDWVSCDVVTNPFIIEDLKIYI